jgi:hypothetical protein
MAARCEVQRLDGEVVLFAEDIDLVAVPRTTNMVLNLENLTGLQLGRYIVYRCRIGTVKQHLDRRPFSLSTPHSNVQVWK